jgi:hypothetical protein
MSGTLDGESSAAATPGVKGGSTAAGGIGVYGESKAGEGVHGISHATFAGVGGYNDSAQGGPGVWGEASKNGGEGIHGISHTGNAGVGGYNDSAQGGPGVWGEASKNGGEGVHGISHTGNAGVGGYNDSAQGGAGVWGSSQAGEGVHGESQSASLAAVAGFALNPNGTGAAIYGETHGKGPAGFFKGNVVVTGDVQLTGADCAEQFDLLDVGGCDPGTVMVIDDSGSLVASHREYDHRVAGVIAGAGDLRPGIVLDAQISSERRRPIALVGKVWCKTVADDAAIAVGDLLTTSSVPGHAMKASNPSRAFGAVIGKALQPLPAGIGLIRILIALQ